MNIKFRLLLIVATVLAGCSYPLEKEIIGKWVDDTHLDAGTIEFFSDHTFLLELDQINGTWAVVGNRRIKMDVNSQHHLPIPPGRRATILFENIGISGTRMTCYTMGKEAVFRRVD